MLPHHIREAIERDLETSVVSAVPVSGGCIAEASRLQLAGRRLFLKWGAERTGESIEAEMDGLQALAAAGSELFVPSVVTSGKASRDSYLVVEWIEPGAIDANFWNRFGRGLAYLHRCTSDRWGYERDNYIGRLPQKNGWFDDWVTYYFERRLLPQAERANRDRKWQPQWDGLFAELERRLPDIIGTDEPPSLLHGDLWSGNFLPCDDGRAAIFDPAVYFGHREADLAMTELFGGFDRQFYAAYEEAWPLQPGYDERKDVYNLYHLLNHLNLFGSSYAGGVDRILRRFGC
jgi:protein-ribulosamine 3-kinase